MPKQSRDRFTWIIHFHPHLGPPPSVGGGRIWKVTMIGFAMTNNGNYSNHFRHSGHGGCREPESIRDSDLRIRTGFQIPRLRHLRAGSARNYVTAGQRFPPLILILSVFSVISVVKHDAFTGTDFTPLN